jgi:hypothetical protein
MRMFKNVALLALLSGPGSLPPSYADPASTEPTPPTANITGTIKSANSIVRLIAVDRENADALKTSSENPHDPFIYEGVVDAATGAFHIDRLLPNKAYDLIVWTADAAGVRTRWEGACMDYHRPIIPSTACTPDDRTWLENFVKEMPAFYDKARVLRIAADHKHATLLVELARTRAFHSDKGGELIYRVELWYFENLFGGWAKDKNTERVLVRWRGDGNAIDRNWQFLPELGGLTPGQAPITLTLPDHPLPTRGLAGSPP